jgi:hypothetical protein
MVDGMADAYELTILMPCINEAETLGRCIDKAQRFLARSGIRGEVLIADNGLSSSCQTPDLHSWRSRTSASSTMR